MTDTAVATLVRRAYEGEVLGEALFGALVASWSVAEQRRKLAGAWMLEAQTRDAVARLAADMGVTLGAATDQAEAGRQAAASMAAMPWPDMMGAIAGATANYRSLYAELRDAAPDPEHPVLAELLRHEEALNAFAAAEVAGDPHAFGVLLGALDDDHRARVPATAESA